MDDSNTVAAPAAPLWRQPHELLSMIFDLAYPKSDTELRIVFNDDWERRESYNEMRDCNNYVLRPFPTLKVNEWRVSKRSFLLAAAAWMSQQRFNDGPNGHFSGQVSGFLSREVGLFLENATEICGLRSWPVGQDVHACRRLRTLHVVVWDAGLTYGTAKTGEKWAWRDEFGEDDFAKLPFVAALGALRGLKQFVMTPGPQPCFAKTDHQLSVFERNVESLGTMLVPWVTAPRVQSGSTTEPRAERGVPM